MCVCPWDYESQTGEFSRLEFDFYGPEFSGLVPVALVQTVAERPPGSDPTGVLSEICRIRAKIGPRCAKSDPKYPNLTRREFEQLVPILARNRPTLQFRSDVD